MASLNLNTYLQKVPHFVWSVSSYQDFLESEEGKKQQAQIRLTMLETLYGQAEVQKMNQALFDQQSAPVNQGNERNSIQNNPRKELSQQDRDRLLKGDAQRIAKKTMELATITSQSQELLSKITSKDAKLSEQAETFHEEHTQCETKAQKYAKTLESKQSKISQEDYDEAISNFYTSSQTQGYILQVARQRQAEVDLLESQANILRASIIQSETQLGRLSQETPAYKQQAAQIAEAKDTLAHITERAKIIRSAVKKTEENATTVLGNNAREESRWEMAKQQSNIGMTAEEIAARKKQKSALNAAILSAPKSKPTPASRNVAADEEAQPSAPSPFSTNPSGKAGG